MTDPTHPVETANDQSPILQYFEYAHLPMNLRERSRDFYQFAHHLEKVLPRGPEKTTALRKLLESKDAAVRAALT